MRTKENRHTKENSIASVRPESSAEDKQIKEQNQEGNKVHDIARILRCFRKISREERRITLKPKEKRKERGKTFITVQT
jgi:hypothetical protein